MSADLRTTVVQNPLPNVSGPSTVTHPHHDAHTATVQNETPTLEPAAKFELSSEAQELMSLKQESALSSEEPTLERKIKTRSEAQAVLKNVQEQITQSPTLAKVVHTNFDTMRILQKIY